MLCWLDALRDAEVVVAGPAGRLIDVEVPRSTTTFARAAARILKEGLPLHTILAAREWEGVLRDRGRFDVSIVLLTRTEPWTRGRLPHATRRIIDVVDSAAATADQRALAVRGLTRRFWASEAIKSARLERELQNHCDAVVAVTAGEAARFGTKGIAIPVGVRIEPLVESERTIDFAFWGRLAYFANEEAVRILVRDIWPRIRAIRPRATLLIAGADAPRWIRALDGHDSIRVESPMQNRAEMLRRVRVALLPVMHGSGQSLKALEAAEAGCAIVATRCALRGAERLAAQALIADEPEALAAAAATLVDDRAAGEALRALVVAHYSHDASLAPMRHLAGLS